MGLPHANPSFARYTNRAAGLPPCAFLRAGCTFRPARLAAARIFEEGRKDAQGQCRPPCPKPAPGDRVRKTIGPGYRFSLSDNTEINKLTTEKKAEIVLHERNSVNSRLMRMLGSASRTRQVPQNGRVSSHALTPTTRRWSVSAPSRCVDTPVPVTRP